MGYRKFISFFISIVMVVALVSSTVLADGPDEGEGNGDGNRSHSLCRPSMNMLSGPVLQKTIQI